jgi:hypothetical protein
MSVQKLPPTLCIAEVREFDAGPARTNAKLKNKCTDNEQMFTDAGQAGTNGSQRSNVHCFNVQPVFWQC